MLVYDWQQKVSVLLDTVIQDDRDHIVISYTLV